ncbi:MAG: M13 family metallopeptidase [Vicinamibacteria bacterium]
MKKLIALTGLGLAAVTAQAQDTAAKPKIAGFDVTALDRSANACTDFYQFACGGWMKANPVPADRPRWGRFDELQDRNRDVLREILNQISASSGGRTPIDQRIGDHYAACMDEVGTEAKGAKPLDAELAAIAAVADKAALTDRVARLQMSGTAAFFGYGSLQDFKDATKVLAVVDQGGLGLPDRDYYFKEDARSQEIRTKYVAHVQKMLELLGDAPDAAAASAKTVMEMETALAKVSLERVKRRDPENLYHKMSRADLATLAPEIKWEAFFTATGAPAFTEINVTHPEFFKGLSELIKTRPLADWKTYLRWHLVRQQAALLSSAFVNESFEFFGKTLTGAKELRPRWKRCVDRVDNDLGDALGQRYVEKTFGAEGKQRMNAMVAALEKALEADIQALPWMTDPTKKKGLEKLRAIANKVGYPDKWRDYTSVKILRDDAVGNAARAAAYEFKRDLDKIGKPVDRGEWQMSPPTVNAYYSPLLNDINFPVGILQPPFFDNKMDDAVNFGGIGAVIGHELTHGFDDSGRKFDAQGNLQDWWTEADGKAFVERAQCIDDQYGSYTAVDDVKLNGKLTLGENVADNGGLRIAHMALMNTLAGKTPAAIDGFSADQRLFLGWAQIWCQNATPEISRMLAQTDSHSPGRYRVNGTVSNMPEFQKAYQCKAGDAMVSAKPCRVW